MKGPGGKATPQGPGGRATAQGAGGRATAEGRQLPQKKPFKGEDKGRPFLACVFEEKGFRPLPVKMASVYIEISGGVRINVMKQIWVIFSRQYEVET